MSVVGRQMRIGLAAWCLVAMFVGQALFLPGQVGATGEVGRPPLPDGIVRLPFNGEQQITQVPGCGEHTRKINLEKQYNEMNMRAFDFGLSSGTEVVAAGEGDVLPYFTDPGGSKILTIDHGNGVRSHYVHLSEYLKAPGDHVQAGDVIALSGESGAAGQPHLHFAVTIGNDDSETTDKPVTTTGVAASINSLPGIEWDHNTLNDDGYVVNCGPSVPNDIAVGGAVAPLPTTGDTTLVGIAYDRNAAVNTAYGAFGDGDEFNDDSANFVSKALWGGGLLQTDDWNQDVLANPDNLVNYLTASHPIDNNASYTPGTKTELIWSNDVPTGADLGDVIAYDYEGDGIIDHVAIVTGFTKDGPTVTEHSPTHQDRYWTYSEEDSAWIAEAHPGAVAYLIHIVPTTLPNF